MDWTATMIAAGGATAGPSDLRAQKPDVFARLKTAFTAWNAQMLPRLPQ